MSDSTHSLVPRRHRMLALLGALALGASMWAFVGDAQHAPRAGERDHEMARRALQEGKVLPLRSVLDIVERQYPGQVLEVEFEHDDGRFIYEIRLLQSDGRLAKLKVDGVNGQVLSVKQKKKKDN